MSIGAPPVGTPPNMTTPGSLTSLLDGLVALQATIPTHPLLEAYSNGGPQLRCYRWRPNTADLPGLWNWLLPSSAEMRDLSRIRDTVNISTQIGVRFTDVEDRMGYVEAVADAYRAIVDPSYWDGQRTPPATRGYATWAIRTSMQTFTADIGGVPVVGIEFLQQYFIDRHV